MEQQPQSISLKSYSEIKDCSVMIDGQNLFDHPVKNDLRTYDNIQKTATGQEDDCTTDCLLDYPCFI